MRSDDFADVVVNVEGRVGVLVWELAVAIRSGDARAGGVACVSKTCYATELDVEELVGRIAWERQRKIETDARIGRRIRIGRIECQIVLTRAENEFIGQRRRESGRDVERAVPWT
jgi:hypothetical protein